jgi:predicted nuclease with TOPRIM domain
MERKRCGMYPSDQAHDDCLELLKVVDELLNGKALNSLHNQIVKLEVENAELKGANILLNEQNDKLRSRIESLEDQIDSDNWRT